MRYAESLLPSPLACRERPQSRPVLLLAILALSLSPRQGLLLPGETLRLVLCVCLRPGALRLITHSGIQGRDDVASYLAGESDSSGSDDDSLPGEASDAESKPGTGSESDESESESISDLPDGGETCPASTPCPASCSKTHTVPIRDCD